MTRDRCGHTGAQRARITFHPLRAAAASATMSANSVGSTRSSQMRTVLRYSEARARRSFGFFARSSKRAIPNLKRESRRGFWPLRPLAAL